MSGGGDDSTRKPATRLIRGGRRPEWTGPVVNPPVWRASTHLYEKDADRHAAGGNNADGQFFYGRRGAPTQWALAEALTQIEPGAYGTQLYPSGVAAIAGAMLAVLKPGSLHIMLFEVGTLSEQTPFPLTLTMDDGQKLELSLPVKPIEPMAEMKHMKH